MKTCAKLLGKCVLVLLPLIALILFFSASTLSFIDGEAPYYIWNKEVSNAAQGKYYDTLILGDSVANASYLPEILSDSTINLSLGGTTPIENYYALLNWLEHHEAPRTCYVSYMDFHLQREDCFWTRTMYSHKFDLKDNIAMLRSAVEHNEPSILREHYLLDFISYESRLPNKYITAFMNASFNQRKQTNTAALSLADLHCGRYIGLSTVEYAPDNVQTFKNFPVKPIFDTYNRMLLDLCRENGIQVRLIRLPMPENCVYTEEYSASFHAYYDTLQAEYPGTTVDWFPLYSNTCFFDVHHMNSYGALLFSSELKELYPEDFGDEPLTNSQIAGINDYLTKETNLTHIFDWIAGRDYTVLLYDPQGRLEDMYGGEVLPEVSDTPLTVRRTDGAQFPAGENVFCVSGTNGPEPDIAVYRGEDRTLMIQPSGGEAQPWTMAPNASLGVIVLDNYNNSIVCMKSFSYAGAAFTQAA